MSDSFLVSRSQEVVDRVLWGTPALTLERKMPY